MTLSLLGNSNHLAVSVSTDFPSNLKGDVSFHYIAYDYYPTYRDGLFDNLGDV